MLKCVKFRYYFIGFEMKIKYFLQLIILFLSFFVFILPCTAEEATVDDAHNYGLSVDEAQDWAESKGQEILDILTGDSEDKFTKLDEIADNDVDLKHAARFVIGKYWKQMSEEQKQKYLSLFNRYSKSLYKSYSPNIQKGEITFSVDKAVMTKIGVAVYCTVKIKKVEEKVDEASKGGVKVIFSLVKYDGKIKVRDLKIEESSFLQAYRERFYKMIHEDSEDDIDWFLEDLEAIVRDNENKFEEADN